MRCCKKKKLLVAFRPDYDRRPLPQTRPTPNLIKKQGSGLHRSPAEPLPVMVACPDNFGKPRRTMTCSVLRSRFISAIPPFR
jgi:hypothetical protein